MSLSVYTPGRLNNLKVPVEVDVMCLPATESNQVGDNLNSSTEVSRFAGDAVSIPPSPIHNSLRAPPVVLWGGGFTRVACRN